MNSDISNVISRLTEDSKKEKGQTNKVSPEDRMLAITKDTGEFFNILLKGINAKKILEVGTSTGYSTLWFADAVRENSGRIITIEQNPSKILRAKRNFQEAKVDGIIEIKEGNALKMLQRISAQEELFDFVFLDADKENTADYFEIALKITKIGGIIAIDNMLYPEKYRDHMSNISQIIKKNANVQSITLAIGNGEEIILKLSN